MNIALWVAQGLLAVMYAGAGGMKLLQTQKYLDQMKWQSDRKGLVVFIGTMEWAGVLGMVLPMLTGILPWLTPVAAAGLALVQVLAILTVHLPGKQYRVLPMNLLLLALAIFVAVGRWGLLVR